MTKEQEDTLNMYEATDDVLQTNNAVWSANAPFSTAVSELETNIDTIGELRDIQETDNTGVAEDKEERRQTLENSTYQVASILVFYASATNNRKLLNKVNFTRSEFTHARDNELPGMSGQVHAEAVTNAVAAITYGLTALMTSDLDSALNGFVDYISKPRAAKTETVAATSQLPPVFEDTDTLLTERLDKAMELFRLSNPDFYGEYFTARLIVNSPTQKRALEATFKDSVTGNPIEKVKVKVDSSINRRSSSLGNIQVQNLTEGSHSLTASIPGYSPVSQPFNVVSGITTKLVITMTKV